MPAPTSTSRPLCQTRRHPALPKRPAGQPEGLHQVPRVLSEAVQEAAEETLRHCHGRNETPGFPRHRRRPGQPRADRDDVQVVESVEVHVDGYAVRRLLQDKLGHPFEAAAGLEFDGCGGHKGLLLRLQTGQAAVLYGIFEKVSFRFVYLLVKSLEIALPHSNVFKLNMYLKNF